MERKKRKAIILPASFYNRDTRTAARELLGKFLVRNINGKMFALPIIETEAYIGPHDKACHASKGRTKRTEVMFGPPGRAYIYLIYGMYYCLNIVTKRAGYPSAVLIRGLMHPSGGGPGKLTRLLRVTKTLNGTDITNRENGLWVEDRGVKIKRGSIITSPRIGVGYAEEWSKKPFRYIINVKLS